MHAGFGQLDLLVGDGTIPVTVANHAENSFTVQLRSFRTGTCFYVTGEAAGGSEIGFT